MNLTPRQREIVARLMRGQPDKNIAADLGISICTVGAHVDTIRAALGVRGTRPMLVAELHRRATEAVR